MTRKPIHDPGVFLVQQGIQGLLKGRGDDAAPSQADAWVLAEPEAVCRFVHPMGADVQQGWLQGLNKVSEQRFQRFARA